MAHNTKMVDITTRKENKKAMDKVKKLLDDIKLTLFGPGGGGADCAPPRHIFVYIFCANTCPEPEVWLADKAVLTFNLVAIDLARRAKGI